jgi:hypothetical protein
MFSTLVKYKAKFAIWVISSFEDYDDNQVGCFFHSFQFYYIFTKFNWYVCRVGLSLGSPLVCSSVSPSRLQSSWQREGLQSKIYSPQSQEVCSSYWSRERISPCWMYDSKLVYCRGRTTLASVGMEGSQGGLYCGGRCWWKQQRRMTGVISLMC